MPLIQCTPAILPEHERHALTYPEHATCALVYITVSLAQRMCATTRAPGGGKYDVVRLVQDADSYCAENK